MRYKCHQCGNEHSTDNMVAYCACCVAKLQERVAGEYRDMKTYTMTVTIDDTEYEVEYEWSKPRPAVMTLSNGDPGYPVEGGYEGIIGVKQKFTCPTCKTSWWSKVEPDSELSDTLDEAVEQSLEAT